LYRHDKFMRLLAPILILVLSTTIVVTLGAGPRPGERLLAAVYPPWWSDARIAGAAASAGDIAAAGGVRNVLVIHGDPTGFATRVRRSGALLVLGGDAARLCADPQALEA
jgi:hypothetical protein